MQKTRPRRTGRKSASGEGTGQASGHTTGPAGTGVPTGGAPEGGAPGDGRQGSGAGTPSGPAAAAAPVGRGRPTHVRNRLIVAVAVVAAAVAGAGAPSVIAASQQVSGTQDLVTLADRTEEALVLAHALADERDEVTAYIAAGRPRSKAPSEQRSARVDRRVEELRQNADTPADLKQDLDTVASVRRSALTGKSSALQTHQAYSAAITELHRVAEDLAGKLPPRAGAGGHALAELDTAVQQAAAARGLLIAALSLPSDSQTVIDPYTGLSTTESVTSADDVKRRDALSTAAQQARQRSDAALAGFREAAPKSMVSAYDSTVTGSEADSAEGYLARLTDQPTFSDDDLTTSTAKARAALWARVDLMRGAESALYDERTKSLEKLRDDDVTALEIRIAVLGVLLLVALGIAMAMARSLTRPLAVLRIGSARVAADPAAEEPVKFTGRNDEFAQVVRSVNALHAHAAALQERITTLESDRKHLIGGRQKMADAREELRAELDAANATLQHLRSGINGSFVNLALRTLGLVERQLSVIEGLEEREDDPEQLSTLFKLDHFATVMRRHSENLLVLAGAEHGQQHAGAVPLVDVVRAAVSEIERYERVRIAALPPHAHVAGFAADDLSHLLAELLENATAFSPPEMPVEVSGWLLENGEVMLSVRDEGIGMSDERMTQLNARLTEIDPEEPHDPDSDEGLGLGLHVVALLAHRHGVRVQLREQKAGGVTAVAVLPKALLAAAPPIAGPVSSPVPGSATGTTTLPGAYAEANSNVLTGRSESAVTSTATSAAPSTAVSAAVASGGADGGEGAEDEGETSAPETVTAPAEVQDASGLEATPAATESEPDHAPASTPVPESLVETTMPLKLPPFTTGELRMGSVPAGEAPARTAGNTAGSTAGEAAQGTPEAQPPAGSDDVAGDHDAAPGPYAIGPDTHERAEDEASEETLTDKGLPKRTPRVSAPARAPRPRSSGSVDADALRRRLGGFYRGAKDGRRDVEAELAGNKPAVPAPGRSPEATPDEEHPGVDHAGPEHHRDDAGTEKATGGTVEEATS